MVRTKFYWSWVGGKVLVVRNANPIVFLIDVPIINKIQEYCFYKILSPVCYFRSFWFKHIFY